ncbi:hypothetical protein Scep_008364 [Stephania cephalantha]|uniref:Uncharacterized protein n=1 Tax=Stephania cephalantha TaxID=152367 RepID=A0AAP0KBU2_9MAGN
MADGVFREDVVDVGDYEIRDLFSDSCSDESESSGMHIYARPSTTTTTTIGLGFRVLPFFGSFVDSCNGLLIIGEPGFANLPDLFASPLLCK